MASFRHILNIFMEAKNDFPAIKNVYNPLFIHQHSIYNYLLFFYFTCCLKQIVTDIDLGFLLFVQNVGQKLVPKMLSVHPTHVYWVPTVMQHKGYRR